MKNDSIPISQNHLWFICFIKILCSDVYTILCLKTSNCHCQVTFIDSLFILYLPHLISKNTSLIPSRATLDNETICLRYLCKQSLYFNTYALYGCLLESVSSLFSALLYHLPLTLLRFNYCCAVDFSQNSTLGILAFLVTVIFYCYCNFLLIRDLGSC